MPMIEIIVLHMAAGTRCRIGVEASTAKGCRSVCGGCWGGGLSQNGHGQIMHLIITTRTEKETYDKLKDKYYTLDHNQKAEK